MLQSGGHGKRICAVLGDLVAGLRRFEELMIGGETRWRVGADVSGDDRPVARGRPGGHDMSAPVSRKARSLLKDSISSRLGRSGEAPSPAMMQSLWPLTPDAGQDRG